VLGLESWEEVRHGRSRHPPAAAPLPSTLADAGRLTAVGRRRVLRRRRHPQHPKVDPAATHAHRHRCHRACLRPRPVRRGHPGPRRRQHDRGRREAVGAGRLQQGGGDRPAHQHGGRQALRVPADAEAIAVGQGALWVASVAPGDLGTPGEDTVTRIDLATGRRVATVTVGRAPLDLAATPGAVWVPNAGGGGDSVARIDPHTNRLAAGRPPGPAPRAWPPVAGRCGSPTMTPGR
jgi:DNA-binding beta-propeller fold protein YncE